MSGGFAGTAAVMAASAGGPDVGGSDSGPGEGRGVRFVHCVVGGAGGCGDASGASGIAFAGVAGTGWGVGGNDVSALVSSSMVLMRCQRSGNLAAGSVMRASGDMT